MNNYRLDEKRELVNLQLKNFVDTQDFKVLSAQEAGSRVKNLHSPDSDFDVKFFFVRSMKTYASPFYNFKESSVWDVNRKGFNVEDEDLDFEGWDVQKVTQFALTSNTNLLEWLASPYRYQDNSMFTTDLTKLLKGRYSVKKAQYHYRGTALNNYKWYLASKEKVNLKKYFQVFRPLFMLEWLDDNGNKELPLLDFGILMEEYGSKMDCYELLNDLYQEKLSGALDKDAEKLKDLDKFLEKKLESVRDAKFTSADPKLDKEYLEFLALREMENY